MEEDTPVVELLDVEKVYASGPIRVKALRALNLTVKKGEFVVLTGPSGCGKSTLLNLMGCLDLPTGGKVLIDGVDVTTLSDPQLAAIRNRRIGFVFQMYNLLPGMNAQRNVELPLVYAGTTAKERKGRVREVLAEVRLEFRAHHRPSELSGGERQRVAIARALVTAPSLLLADEPTGNLDTVTGTEIMDVFKVLSGKGVTIFLVSHNPDIETYATRVIRMRDGRLI